MLPWDDAYWAILRSVLDVLVVYYLIYKVLLLVRGTRAEYVLKGLGVIAVIYVASRFLGLVTLNWVLGNFLGSMILVVVVLFQDDLRRGLSKVGLIPGLGAEVSQALEMSIREVAKAVGELASRRIGALMVIRREVGLEDYTEHAVKIDSVVSRELLISIFLRTSPLHDGAVVIAGDRIVAAGAVLPLSFNPSVSAALGTRHRAALGLSERTDAVVVVVSEETGTVSVVADGKINRNLGENELYNMLHRYTVYRQQRRAARRGKKGLIQNIFTESGTSSEKKSEDERGKSQDRKKQKETKELAETKEVLDSTENGGVS